MLYRFLNICVRISCNSNEQDIILNNIFYKLLEGATKFILSSFQKTGRISKDSNLPIDEEKSYYPTSNNKNTNKQS